VTEEFAGFPYDRHSFAGNGDRRDVNVYAPQASAGAANNFGLPPQPVLPTPEELCQILSVENIELRRNAERHALAAGTMAAIALSLAQMLEEESGSYRAGDRIVRIPRDLYRRMHGCQITASTEAVTKDGDVLVHIRERVDSPGWEN
jgi:hypothetical protein